MKENQRNEVAGAAAGTAIALVAGDGVKAYTPLLGCAIPFLFSVWGTLGIGLLVVIGLLFGPIGGIIMVFGAIAWGIIGGLLGKGSEESTSCASTMAGCSGSGCLWLIVICVLLPAWKYVLIWAAILAATTAIGYGGCIYFGRRRVKLGSVTVTPNEQAEEAVPASVLNVTDADHGLRES